MPQMICRKFISNATESEGTNQFKEDKEFKLRKSNKTLRSEPSVEMLKLYKRQKKSRYHHI